MGLFKFELMVGDRLEVRKLGKRSSASYLYNNSMDLVVARTCNGCGQWHMMDRFNKAQKGFEGKHSLCKECHRKADRSVKVKPHLGQVI
ncbi:hypothetical protein [Halobacillus karajensis]|uniref:hypothetical protein n=1 Tax=Halobacillus karajensis TaxID=195088 RepID=UPI00045C49A5|nr:hypothetical protein [Halobacillus karajensis]CDQ21678.1 hypothetical protein BN982_04087 [Halobacillus karajensis]